MAPKGGTFFLLLIGACAALVSAERQARSEAVSLNEAVAKRMAQKLMMHCKKEGYPLPEKKDVVAILLSEAPENIRDFSLEDHPILSVLQTALDSVSLLNRNPPERAVQMAWNYTDLPGIVTKLKSFTNSSKCYLKAFLAPLALAALKDMPDRNMDIDDYKSMLWVAKPALFGLPSERMQLPSVSLPRMKAIMEMLREEFEDLNRNQRKKLLKWMVSQTTKNLFNCTLGTRQSLPTCEVSTEWLTSNAIDLMGAFTWMMPPRYVDAIPVNDLKSLFKSGTLKSSLDEVKRLNPRLGQRLFDKVRSNIENLQFFSSLARLGKLACFFNMSEMRSMDFDNKTTLLSQLDDCKNPSAKKLRRMLLRSVFSENNNTDALLEMGRSITLLSPKQLSRIPADNITAILRNLGPKVRWSKAQMRTLVRKQLGGKKCKEVSVGELMQLGSLLEGLPNCMMQLLRPQDILEDAGLRNMTMRMKKRQLKAILQGLSKTKNISSLVDKLPGPLLRSVPLSKLKNANLSFEQVVDRTWTLQQAALLVRQLYEQKALKFGGLNSLLQGVTCKMIEAASEAELEELTQSMQESPEWLSRAQVSCTAHKVFATLEQQRPGFFTTLSEGDLISIPTNLLLYLPAMKVENLPEAVCDAFLDKMETADLSVLPATAPSRAAFAEKALQCLTGTARTSGGESELTMEQLARVGELVCELPPSQLALLNPTVLNATLHAMAACANIPETHRAGIVKLVKQIYGDVTEWDADLMEMLGPLILLDDRTVDSLPNKPWMKDVLYFLKSRLIDITTALKRKFFALTLLNAETNNSGPPGRRRRAARSSTNITNVTPTLEMIQELGENNVFWTPEQLEDITVEDFKSAVEIFGDISDFEKDQISVLSQKAVEAFGAVKDMDDTTVAQIGCLAQGFPDADLEKLSVSMDSLDDFEECEWNVSQMTPLWTGISTYNNLTAAALTSADLVALDLFVCGLSSTEITALSPEVFMDAVGAMDGLACSYEVAQQLKEVALEAYGDPSTWTEADVADLGNMIAGLTAEELALLDPAVFSFMPESAIPLIPSDNLAALSVEQLLSLGPDNAAQLTDDQLGSLSPAQTNALDQALSGSLQPLIGFNSASSVSVEGISALVRTLLLLLSCFLLL